MMDDPITTEYAQNCQMYDFIVGLAELLSGGTQQQKEDEIAYLTGGVLNRYESLFQKEVIANKEDDREYVLLPQQNFNAFFSTSFSQKWIGVLNGKLIEKKVLDGVCQYRIVLE